MMVQKLFYSFDINSIDDFFTDAIKSDSSIVNLVKSLAYDLDSFASLTEAYRAGQLKEKKGTLVSRHMKLIENAKNDVASNLRSIMSYKIKNIMPTHLLSCTAMKKNEEVKKLLMTIPQLQNLLCDKFVIKQIKKRIKERSDRLSYSTTRRSSEFAQFYSSNNSKLTWQDTFQNIFDMENSNIQSAALDYEKLGNIASIICENLLVTIKELEIPSEMAYIQQIIDTMPVIFVSNEHMHAFINLHEFVFIPGSLEYILSPAKATSVSSVGETEDSISCETLTTSPNEPQESSKSKTGQPAIIAKFPGIVDVVADFPNT